MKRMWAQLDREQWVFIKWKAFIQYASVVFDEKAFAIKCK